MTAPGFVEADPVPDPIREDLPHSKVAHQVGKNGTGFDLTTTTDPSVLKFIPEIPLGSLISEDSSGAREFSLGSGRPGVA